MIFKQLGIVSQLRGTDGSGVFQTRTTGVKTQHYDATDSLLFKTYSPFSSLGDEADGNKANKDLMSSVMVDVIMGHVRASTQGVISDANAHPFEFDNLVGAHNGTLKDTKYLSHPVKTDSELMFKDISKRGISPVLTELDRDSAFAIVIYNKMDKHLYFVRNELRTLAFAFNKKRGVLYWASEAGMLRFILDRYSQDYKVFTMYENLVIKLKPSDITTANNAKEDPLGILKVHDELTRPIPTAIQKMRDEKEKAKQREKKTTQAPNWTPDQYSFDVTEGKKEEVKSSTNVIPLAHKRTEPFRVRSCYTLCSCGKTSLNLLEANQTHRGIHPRYRYDKGNKKIYCDQCPDNKIECKEIVG